MRPNRPVALALLVTWLVGCAHYQPTQRPITELAGPPRPVSQMRVTLANGTRVQVTNPRVDQDTLRGTEGLARTSGPPVAIPLASITGVEVSPPKKHISTGLSVLLVVGAAVVVALVATADWDCGFFCE